MVTRLSLVNSHLKATSAGRINSRQIEAARITMTREMKRQGKSLD